MRAMMRRAATMRVAVVRAVHPIAAWTVLAALAALSAATGCGEEPASVVSALAAEAAADSAVSGPAGHANSAADKAAPIAAHDVVLGTESSPVAQPPQLLSETGLYLADGSIDPRNRPFVPQYPLWSDGAKKSRWIRLPEGAKIDVSDIDAWRFPAGTTFWKEFAWGGRKIETRMIRVLGGGEWVFATYVWSDDQTDAALAPADGVPGIIEIAAGKVHSIPAVSDCHACHESSPGIVLGFNALQLSDDRDPLAPNAEPLREGALTLRSLVDEDRLEPPRADLAQHPPRIRESDPVARAALGYLSANCGGCHNDRGPLARLGLVFLHDAGGAADAPEPARVTAIGATGRYIVPGVSADSSRIVAPGAPEHSALLHRMKSRRPASQMPPLGTVLPDQESIRLVQRWIESLATPPVL